MQRAVGFLHLDGEVHAGAAVQLADDDALGPVDDELPAAHHDRHFADVDGLFEDFLFVFALEAAVDAQRQPVGQPKVAAFLGFVARLAELVVVIGQRHRLVVADDGEDFPQEAFEALLFSLFGFDVLLKEPIVADGLEIDQRRDRGVIADLAEIPDLIGS